MQRNQSALGRFLVGVWFWPVLWCLLLAPHFFTGPPAKDFALRFGWPGITSGDEPDYLVTLHSLLHDGDFDLKNNYDAARLGGLEAGRRANGLAHPHHVAYWVGGKWIGWYQVFDDQRLITNVAGRLAYAKKPGAPAGIEWLPEYSSHPPGLALILAAGLWPWRDSLWLESGALFLTGLMTCWAAWSFAQLARRFGADETWTHGLTLLAFLGTPAWHYGRTLFSEPWLLALALLGLQAFFGARPGQSGRFAAAGLALGLGVLMKPPFALVALPLCCWLAWSWRWRDLLMFIGPIALGCAAMVTYDAVLWGSPWHTPQSWRSGNLLTALVGLWMIPGKSLCFCAPILLPAALAWPRFLRNQGARGWIVLTAALPFALLMVAWEDWGGGYCYGPRLLLPIMPLLILAGTVWPQLWAEAQARPKVRIALASLVGVSLCVNLAAVVCYEPMWASATRWIRWP